MERRDTPTPAARLDRVHRAGAAAGGAVLVVLGCLGFAGMLTPFGTRGTAVAGLSSDGVLSLTALGFGALLPAASRLRGSAPSTAGTAVGALLVPAGFVQLGVLDGPGNLLGPTIPNVLFSFAMGLVLLTLGMYGRFTGGLPSENPYWRARNVHLLDRRTAVAGPPAGSPLGPGRRTAAEIPARPGGPTGHRWS